MFSLALFVIPLVLNLVFYNQLPDVVPTHFDVNGQVDGTMPKFMGLFGMLFLCLAIHVFTCFVSVKDPKRNNIPNFMMNIFIYDLSRCLHCDKYDDHLFWFRLFV